MKKDILFKPNEVVINDEEITMIITHPLSVEVKVDLKRKGDLQG